MDTDSTCLRRLRPAERHSRPPTSETKREMDQLQLRGWINNSPTGYSDPTEGLGRGEEMKCGRTFERWKRGADMKALVHICPERLHISQACCPREIFQTSMKFWVASMTANKSNHIYCKGVIFDVAKIDLMSKSERKVGSVSFDGVFSFCEVLFLVLWEKNGIYSLFIWYLRRPYEFHAELIRLSGCVSWLNLDTLRLGLKEVDERLLPRGLLGRTGSPSAERLSWTKQKYTYI